MLTTTSMGFLEVPLNKKKQKNFAKLDRAGVAATGS
jgi:hypothetical protein